MKVFAMIHSLLLFILLPPSLSLIPSIQQVSPLSYLQPKLNHSFSSPQINPLLNLDSSRAFTEFDSSKEKNLTKNEILQASSSPQLIRVSNSNIGPARFMRGFSKSKKKTNVRKSKSDFSTLKKKGIEDLAFSTGGEMNERPIIGIVSQPSSWINMYDPDDFSYIASSYVQSIQGAGARVLPIKYDLSDEEIFKFMDKVNGILLPGGGTELTFDKDDKKEKFGNLTNYGKQIIKIIKYAEKLNQKIYFPVWGTCLGYESILLAAADNNTILENYDSSNHTQSLQFVQF
jgi:hypothetical protein